MSVQRSLIVSPPPFQPETEWKLISGSSLGGDDG